MEIKQHTLNNQWVESESESEVAQLCPTLCGPTDCSPSGSSVHGILQARILEWVAISFSRGSSRPRDRTQVSHIAGKYFNLWVTREVEEKLKREIKEYLETHEDKNSIPKPMRFSKSSSNKEVYTDEDLRWEKERS